MCSMQSIPRSPDPSASREDCLKTLTCLVNNPCTELVNNSKLRDLEAWQCHFENFDLLDSAQGLAFCRITARNAAVDGGIGGDKKKIRVVHYFASAWVRHLISPEGTRERFFLQEYVARDEGLYDAGSLRPRKWESDSCWRTAYPWVTHPERLTITEMELVLAIFRPFSAGSEGRPRLVGWLERYPHLLWRIHRFLLSRYCFQLLPAFREALRAGRWTKDSGDQRTDATGSGEGEPTSGSGQSTEGQPATIPGKTQSPPGRTLNAPPFRAGEFVALYPRIGGLVAIGLLGFLQVEIAQSLFFETGWFAPFVAGIGALVLLFSLNYMDVYKQNRGVMSDRRHGIARAVSLLRRFLVWGVTITGLYLLCVQLVSEVPGSDRLAKAVFGGSVWDVVLKAFATATTSCLLGALLQWFFEDTAATEPI